MVKAVFFDWFNTLARYEPPREELHSQVLHEIGIEVSPADLLPALSVADSYLYRENALSPLEKRSPEEKTNAYLHYTSIMLAEVGVNVAPELPLKIMERWQQLFQGMTFVLFDDVLATMQTLKERNFILGLLTNLAKGIDSISQELGLKPYLDFIVSSGEVGVDKPKPPIFLAALERAGVNASEAVHVGDQYQIDVVGARGVGISPILIDRYNLYHDVTDCPRIRTLPEVIKFL